jgi:hypothetical protein
MRSGASRLASSQRRHASHKRRAALGWRYWPELLEIVVEDVYDVEQPIRREQILEVDAVRRCREGCLILEQQPGRPFDHQSLGPLRPAVVAGTPSEPVCLADPHTIEHLAGIRSDHVEEIVHDGSMRTVCSHLIGIDPTRFHYGGLELVAPSLPKQREEGSHGFP